MVSVGNVNSQRMLVLQGKCTYNRLWPSLDMASFLPLFHYNGGFLGMNLHKIYKLLSFESIPVHGRTVDSGSKICQKQQKVIDARETAR